MPLTVVYIDDEPDLCEIFQESYSGPEVKIHTFSDPQKALKEVPGLHPDLVFVDFRLPNITGDKIAAQLALKVPFFLITGDLQVKADFAFTKILQKPVKISEIEAILSSFQK